jgi:hypothetical protein
VERVGDIIHGFSGKCFDSLKPLPNKDGTGRSGKFDGEIRREMVKMAMTPP